MKQNTLQPRRGEAVLRNEIRREQALVFLVYSLLAFAQLWSLRLRSVTSYAQNLKAGFAIGLVLRNKLYRQTLQVLLRKT